MENLTRDAVAARAAGLSYGKYIGKRYEAEQTEKAKAEKARQERLAKRAAEKAEQERLQNAGKKITCVWCGRVFWGNYHRKLCSQECQAARSYERTRIAYYRHKGVPVPLELQIELEQMRKTAIERRIQQEEVECM